MNDKEHIKIDELKLTIINKKWQIKAKPSKELIQEILTIFSMPTLPSSSITTIDQILIRTILSTKSQDDVLTVAAILLNFQTCLDIEVNEQAQLGEVLRKMISFGFFSSQIYELENFSNELHSIILFVSNHLKKSNLNINQCSMATAFLLSCISPYVSKISLFNNLNGLQDILDIYLMKKVINDHVIPYFFDFFLAVFMSLTLDSKLESNEFNIFSNLMKILASTVMTQFSFNFDYISLTKKLLEYLSNHFLSITTRDELFNLIISLASKYEEASSILVEPSNSSKISYFISDYLKLIDFEYPLKKSSNPINLDTKVTNSFILSSQEEFLQPFKIKDDNSEYVTYDDFEYIERKDALSVNKFPEPGELEPIKKVEKISMTIQSLIQRISNLCRSISPQIQQNHIQFMSSFLRSEGARIPIGAFFIDLWAKNISFISPKSVSESFHTCKFFQTALELSFFDYDDYYMKNFISSFIVWIASFSPETISYIVDLINVFQNAIISVKLCPEICDLVVKCSIINPQSFVSAMKCSNFDILMCDDLYFYLYNCNNIESTGRSKEESKRLLENYQLLMRFLVDLAHEPTTFAYLYSKNDFLISVLSQFFCPTTAKFAYEIILRMLNLISIPKGSKGDDIISPYLRTIFKFFATKLFKTQRMPASVLNFIIKFCTLGFEKLENQFSLIFRESHFFDIVVNVAIEQNLQNSIQALLNLFVQVTTSKNCITPNIELFLKLGPMIRSRDDVSVVDFLLKIVFNDDLKMTKSRKIVNPGPLSLLFKIFEDDKEKFRDYLKFVRECFEISKNEAVQTDFTTQLILYLHEYRNKTEKDQEFDLVLDFLKDIMSISITQKDLLLFFQLFTSTKNNIRPFFTGDLLKALNLAIKNYQAKSRSFFSLDSGSKIVLPPISQDLMNSDFSIIMKIELRDRNGSIFNFKNPSTDDVIHFAFNEDKFLRINKKVYETTLVTGKLIMLQFSSVKNDYYVYVNKQLLIHDQQKPEAKKKGSWKNGLTDNVVGEGLDANIEFIKIVYTNKYNKVETYYEFKASSFFEGCAIYKDEAIKVDCPIFHLPPSILDVLVSIGGVQVILPIFNQIEQPTNATNPDPNENLLELALTLLSTILNKSRELMDNNQLQIDFYSIDGFQLVSELLTLISINKFNQPVFDKIFRLFSVITEPDLQNQMIEYILFDLGTWVYIPDIAPLFFDHCFELLIGKIKENRLIANYPSLKIKNLLYLIRCHLFASTNKNDSICLSLTEKKTFLGNTFAERQTVKKLRDSFMSFISELCFYSCDEDDIHALCFFCLDDQDEIFQRSSINLLKSIISKKTKLNNQIFPKLPYKTLIGLLNNNKYRKTSSHLLLLINEILSAKSLSQQFKKTIIAKAMIEYSLFPVAVSYVRQLLQKTSGDFRIAITLNLLSLLVESNQKMPNMNARNANKVHQTRSQQSNVQQNEQTSTTEQNDQTSSTQQNDQVVDSQQNDQNSNDKALTEQQNEQNEANTTQTETNETNENNATQNETNENTTTQNETNENTTTQNETNENNTTQNEQDASNNQQNETNTNDDQNTTSVASSASTSNVETENLIFMSDEDVLKQIVHIYRDLIISISIEEFTENEVFFILFLLHAFLDKKKYETILNDLINITMVMWTKKANDPFGFLHKFVETLEFRAKNDYSDFLRRIYIASLSYEFPKTSVESLTNIICRFMFEIPSFDSYYFLFRFPQPLKPISFHDLFVLANNDSSSYATTYHYSMRINDNCRWLDFDLANQFCEKYLMNPALLFNPQQPKTILLEQISYIVGNGIINKAFLSRAEKLVNLIRSIKNPKSDNDSSISKSRRNAIIILFGCISRQILRSNYNYKNDETTPDQLMVIFKSALEILHNEVYLILKEKVDLSTDINFYLSSFASLITKVESDYENRLLSNSSNGGNNSIDLLSPSSGQSLFDSDEMQSQTTATLGTYTTANDPFISFADISLLNKKGITINVEQYRASLSNYATAYRKMKIHSLKQYKQLFSQLSSENGPWMTPEMPPEIHYKLFNTVTRSLLVPNLKFNDHKEASLARDLGSYENAQAILKEQIAKMKMKTFSTDFSLIDFKDEDEETTSNTNNSNANNKQSNEKDLMICQSQLVTPRKLHSGDLNLTVRAIIFNSKNKYVKIRLNKIKKIMLRRYLMVDTAIEIFTTYTKIYFINFINAQERLKFLNKLSSLKIPTIKFIQKKWEDSKVLLKKLVKKWQDGLLSNFDYLMKINILAGRSFNDLSQYPVFPWVIKDYQSEKLDLNNPEIYRCFSKPIGAIGQQRLALMREKMDQGVGDETKYLYGALYSSPAVVIGYLIRMEPFTSLHVQLQSNRFDVADRLFTSIPSAYESVTTSQMDFRELIPEFFINPDFLKNENNFDLGVSVTTGNRIDDVILPPWCSTPREFIEINKNVLESNFVTRNIHQWIDLIFGPHSRAPLSFQVDNVFSPAFYETSLEGADEAQVTYLKECAACFGCACLQIFDECPEPLSININRKSCLGIPKNFVKIAEFQGNKIVALNSEKSDIVAVSSELHFLLNESKGKLSCSIPPSLVEKAQPFVAVNGRRTVAVALKWSSEVNVYHIKNGNNLILEPSPLDSIPSSFTSSNNVVTAISISNRFLAVAYSDYTLRVFKLDKRQQTTTSTIIGSVTTPSTSTTNNAVQQSQTQSVSQSQSSQQQVTNLSTQQQGGSSESFSAEFGESIGLATKRQVGILSKHTHSILFTSVCERIGAVYSISSDGFLSSMSLFQGGRYLRGVDTGFYEPSLFIVSRQGFIVIAFNGPDSSNIIVYDQNLEKISSSFHEAAVSAWTVAERCGEEVLFIATKGATAGEIARMKLPFLENQTSFKVPQQVTAISFIKKPAPRVALGFASGAVAYANIE